MKSFKVLNQIGIHGLVMIAEIVFIIVNVNKMKLKIPVLWIGAFIVGIGTAAAGFPIWNPFSWKNLLIVLFTLGVWDTVWLLICKKFNIQ